MKNKCCSKCYTNAPNFASGCINPDCSCHQPQEECEHLRLRKKDKHCPDCGEEMFELSKIIFSEKDQPEPQEDSWEKEFDEKWTNKQAISCIIPAQGCRVDDAEELKSFIRSLIASCDNELREPIEELNVKSPYEEFDRMQDKLNQVIQSINRLNKK